MRSKGLLALGLVVLAALPARAQSPDYEGEFFTDLTHRVSKREGVDISHTLRLAADNSHIHPMLVVIDRTGDYPNMPQTAKDFAAKLANDWKVGDTHDKRGILALFAVGDRQYYVAKTTNLDQSVSDGITSAFRSGGVTDALKSGNLDLAMDRAANAIAETLPRYARGGSGGGTTTHTVTRTTHEHRVDSPSYSYSGSSSSGAVCSLPCIGFILIAIVVLIALGSVAGAARGYGPSYGGGYYGGGYGYGGGGGGGFFSGMLTGGLLGYLFGNSGSSYYGGSSYGGGWSSGWGSSGSSYTDTTTTDTWSSSSGGSDWSSGGSSGGGFDSFGGGSFDGGGSGGSW